MREHVKGRGFNENIRCNTCGKLLSSFRENRHTQYIKQEEYKSIDFGCDQCDHGDFKHFCLPCYEKLSNREKRGCYA